MYKLKVGVIINDDKAGNAVQSEPTNALELNQDHRILQWGSTLVLARIWSVKLHSLWHSKDLKILNLTW